MTFYQHLLFPDCPTWYPRDGHEPHLLPVQVPDDLHAGPPEHAHLPRLGAHGQQAQLGVPAQTGGLVREAICDVPREVEQLFL